MPAGGHADNDGTPVMSCDLPLFGTAPGGNDTLPACDGAAAEPYALSTDMPPVSCWSLLISRVPFQLLGSVEPGLSMLIASSMLELHPTPPPIIGLVVPVEYRMEAWPLDEPMLSGLPCQVWFTGSALDLLEHGPPASDRRGDASRTTPSVPAPEYAHILDDAVELTPMSASGRNRCIGDTALEWIGEGAAWERIGDATRERIGEAAWDRIGDATRERIAAGVAASELPPKAQAFAGWLGKLLPMSASSCGVIRRIGDVEGAWLWPDPRSVPSPS